LARAYQLRAAPGETVAQTPVDMQLRAPGS
jgi:hypothetical protein